MAFSEVQTRNGTDQQSAALNPFELPDSGLRDIIAIPRNIPRSVRENIARVIVSDILSEKSYEIKDEKKFLEEFGAFYPIFLTLRNSGVWSEIKNLAKTSRMAAIMALKELLSLIFTLVDDFQDVEKEFKKAEGRHFEKSLSELKDLIKETMELWDRNISGMNPERSEKLVLHTEQLMQNEESRQTIDSLVKFQISSEIDPYISELKKHLESIELLTMMFPGRMWDYSLGELHKEYFENLEKYSSIIAKNAELKKILEHIGQIELESGAKRFSVSPFAKSEMHSVTFSSELQHILPMELIKLKTPLLKRKFYADMLEGKLLAYQLKGKNWVGDPPTKKRKGPLVALVDTSGSMHGAPEIFAKALSLAITKKMMKEERDVKIILFSSAGQTTEIELTNRKKMAKEFLDFIQYSFGGGTDFNTALKSGMDSLKSGAFKGADLLFITDGLSSISDNIVLQEWNSIKKEQDARIFTIVVGNNNLGGLQKISDYSYFIQNADGWNITESPANIVKLIATPLFS